MLNKATLIGNLGQDPEIRYTPNGTATCTLSLATSERRKDKQTGETTEQTEWHRVVLWERLAEIAGEYLRKGSRIYLEGKIKTRKWTDRDGVEKYTTEIIGNELKMLSTREGSDGGGSRDAARVRPMAPSERSYTPAPGGPPAPRREQPKSGTGFDDMDDDIPF